MKRIIIMYSTLIALMLLMTISPAGVFAAPQNVQVTIPSFSVTLNGEQVDSLHREYPLIVYNGITYFPMTYFDCLFLGLETKWDSQTGLAIRNAGVSGLYREYRRNSENSRSGIATIASFPIQTNGKIIDNAMEEYPLLLFRDITYFPLTWRFAAEEFGWAYEFSQSAGLVIQSASPKVTNLGVSIPQGLEQAFMNFTVAKGLFYLRGEDGVVFQGHLTNPDEMKAVYQLPDGTMGSGFPILAGLYAQDHEAYISYRVGGATMGSDVIVHLREDGTWEQIKSGNYFSVTYEDLTVIVQHSVPPANGNLFVEYGEGDAIQAGNPEYLYGWTWQVGEDSAGGGQSHDLYLVGDDIYVLAYPDRDSRDGATSIYRVNTKTNETLRVVDGTVTQFAIENESIYYIDSAANRIYMLPLTESEPRPLTGDFDARPAILDMRIVGESVFYHAYDYPILPGSVSQSRIFRVGDSEPLFTSEAPYGAGLPVLRVYSDYLVITYNLVIDAYDSTCRMMVIDSGGSILFQTWDEIVPGSIAIENDHLYYVDAGLRQVGVVSLKK